VLIDDFLYLYFLLFCVFFSIFNLLAFHLFVLRETYARTDFIDNPISTPLTPLRCKHTTVHIYSSIYTCAQELIDARELIIIMSAKWTQICENGGAGRVMNINCGRRMCGRVKCVKLFLWYFYVLKF
jgi:hypothetical protein